MQITTSPLFSLNLSDVTKGLVLAVVGAILGALMSVLNTGSLVFNWLHIGETGLSAGIAYIAHAFFSDAQIILPAVLKTPLIASSAPAAAVQPTQLPDATLNQQPAQAIASQQASLVPDPAAYVPAQAYVAPQSFVPAQPQAQVNS